MNNIVPLDCVRSIFEMALDKDDYWSLTEFIRVYTDLRCLCKTFAETLTWEFITDLLCVQDIQNTPLHEKPITYTKTQAKSIFSLTEKDLENVPCTEKQNPRFKSAHPMKLYSSTVLIQKAKEKFGSKRLLLEYQEKKKQRSIKRQETVENARHQRQEELERKLHQRGLALRSDSRLCDAYIDHGKGNVEEIVNIMHEMDFYHQHTEYRAFYRKAWSSEKQYSGWCDPDYISQEAKMDALFDFARKHSGCPDYVPPTLRLDVIRIQQEQQDGLL